MMNTRRRNKPESILGSSSCVGTGGDGGCGSGFRGPTGIATAKALEAVGVTAPMDVLTCNDKVGEIGLSTHMDTSIHMKEVHIEKLHVDAKDIMMSLDTGRTQEVLDKMTPEGLKRFIDHCNEMKDLAEKTLLQKS